MSAPAEGGGPAPGDATPGAPTGDEINWWGMLTDPAYLRDPYPDLARLRARAPVHYDPASDIYFVLGHREFGRMAKAPEMGRDTRGWKNGWNTPENAAKDPTSYALFSEFNRQLVNMNPPDHKRMRAVYEDAFQAADLAAFEEMIAREAAGLIAALPAGEPADFMTGFANHLPLRVARNLFEIPPEMDPELAGWNAALLKIGDILMTPDQKAAALGALREFKAFFKDHLASRRADPGDGMLGRTIRALDAGALDEEEALNNLVGMFSGNETTVTLFGNGMLSLLKNPDQLARLRADRDLLPTAVEEMLRFEPGIHFILRVAVEDYDLGGLTIPAGAMAIGLVGAFNRDPARFPEPDTFDVGRKPNPHFLFGGGPHICIGRALARLEGRVAFGMLLDAFPEIALAGEPEWWVDRTNQHGLKSLPLLLRRAGGGS